MVRYDIKPKNHFENKSAPFQDNLISIDLEYAHCLRGWFN